MLNGPLFLLLAALVDVGTGVPEFGIAGVETNVVAWLPVDNAGSRFVGTAEVVGVAWTGNAVGDESARADTYQALEYMRVGVDLRDQLRWTKARRYSALQMLSLFRL